MSSTDQTATSSPSRPRPSLGLKRSESFSAAKAAVPSMAGFSPGGQVAEGYSYLSRSASISTSTRSRPQGLQARRSQNFSPPSMGLSQLPLLPCSTDVAADTVISPSTRTSEMPRRLSRVPGPISAIVIKATADQLTRTLSEVEIVADAAASLPPNPKIWSPSEVAIYLAHVLGLVPRALVEDVTSYVRASRMSGRTFLRLSEKELERQGLNLKWRKLMIEAVRKLRRDALRARIWGNEAGSMRWPRTALEHELDREEEEEESSSVEEDVSFDDDGIVKSSTRSSKLTLKRMRNSNKVRGMIQAFQTLPSTNKSDLTALESVSGTGYVKEQANNFVCEVEQQQRSLHRPLRSRQSTADSLRLGHDKGDSQNSDRRSAQVESKDDARSSFESDSVDMVPTLGRYGLDGGVTGTESSVSECSGTDSDHEPQERDDKYGCRSRYGRLDEDTIRAIIGEQSMALGTTATDLVPLPDIEVEQLTKVAQSNESEVIISPYEETEANDGVVSDPPTSPKAALTIDNDAYTSDDYVFEAPEMTPMASSTPLRSRNATFGSKRGKAMLSLLSESLEHGNNLFSALPGARATAAGNVSARRRNGAAEDEEGCSGTLGRTTGRAGLHHMFTASEQRAATFSKLGNQRLARIASEAGNEVASPECTLEAAFESDRRDCTGTSLMSAGVAVHPREESKFDVSIPSGENASQEDVQAPSSARDENMLVPLTALEPHPSGTGSIKKRSMVLVDRKRFESLARRMTQLESQLESLDNPSVATCSDAGSELRGMFEHKTDSSDHDVVLDCIAEASADIAQHDLIAESTGGTGWKSYISPTGWAKYLSTLNPYFSATPPASHSSSSSDDECSLAALLGRDESEHERHMLSIGAIPAYMLGLGAGLGVVLVREVLAKTR